jgi:hypothetical protein
VHKVPTTGYIPENNMQKTCTVYFLLLFIFLPIISSAGQNSTPTSETILTPFKLGNSEDEVIKLLPALKDVNGMDQYYQDNWHVWLDKNKRILKGIDYSDDKINDEQPYPKTSQQVTIGSSTYAVEKAYGVPDRILSGRSPFFLRNSELVLIYAYFTKGLWIMFTNQTPYSNEYVWRVTSLMVGTTDAINNRLVGAEMYATLPMTQEKRDRIIAAYAKISGTAKELDVFDDYMFNLQRAVFDKVKTKGKYVVSLLEIFPEDEQKAKEMHAELADNSPFILKIQKQAKENALSKYKMSPKQFDQLIANTGKFRADFFTIQQLYSLQIK